MAPGQVVGTGRCLGLAATGESCGMGEGAGNGGIVGTSLVVEGGMSLNLFGSTTTSHSGLYDKRPALTFDRFP